MAEQIWRNNGLPFDQGSGGGGASPAASWDPALVRYIFLDGDAGIDTQAGYIDAPPGTVFTPLQTSAVAVKTTHRVNEIRPPLGAGRQVIVLAKPRATKAIYDFATAGDGLGSEDRSAIGGYALMHARGSDLTNSAADQAQLGFVTSIPGPNTDGSFTIANVTTVPNFGVVITLTGATLPAGAILSGHRLRIESIASGTVYSCAKWGDAGAVPNPAVLLAWSVPSPIAPGDTLFIEEPGFVLHDFFEATDVAVNPRYSGQNLVFAGCTVSTGRCRVGVSIDGPTAKYTHLLIDETTGATLSPTAKGSITIDGSYTNEVGVMTIMAGLGVRAASAGTAVVCTDLLTVERSSFISSNSPPAGCALYGNYSQIRNCAVQSGTFASLTAQILGIDGLLAGPFELGMIGHATVKHVQFVPDWGNGITVTPMQSTPNEAISVEFEDTSVFWGSPSLTAGYVLKPGVYTARFDMDTAHDGTGVELRFDQLVPANKILVDYDSLSCTGFEIEDGQRILCRKNDTPPTTYYPGGELPCPRGKVMHMEDHGAGGTMYPVGMVVGVSVTGLSSFALEETSDNIMTLFGVTLTNCLQGGTEVTGEGYAVVGNDGMMVVRLAATTVSEPWGYPYALSTANPGKATRDFNDTLFPPWVLGPAASVGPSIGSDVVYLIWRPGVFFNQT